MHIRLRREDYKHTKHDIVFSKWEILIGPSDWEDHASGKDGVERYRIHNLPNSCSCPGIYELGVASVPTNESRRLRKFDHENIIVVYLGQADNIRTRLQEYGRSGSHLDHVNLTNRKNFEGSIEGGSGLFKDVFSKGYSIVFSWAPIKSKMEAEKAETELLFIFDYAWNRRGNGDCRHADILAKLNYNSQSPLRSPLTRLLRWKQEALGRRVGIDINAVVPLLEKEKPTHGLKGYLLPQVFKFSSSRLRFLPRDDNSIADQIICGVATGHGSICINQPLPGRKRCAEHRGKKISGTAGVSTQKITSGDMLLVDGTKMCELRKESRLFNETSRPIHLFQAKENGVCGVVSGDGLVCRRRPVFGRKRCEEHKGKRLAVQNRCSSPDSNLCGVINECGHACSKLPVPGNKRCAEHKGRRIMPSR